ncbi:ABC transporter substrate-binding protein [Agarivorans sp. DSG3-1]|uniref:ABC transporter substrate-binding protein n=1 Tax=Agarivorans sp. DSG3-1 TaxID=3342249 RepID=UPI00398E8CCD
MQIRCLWMVIALMSWNCVAQELTVSLLLTPKQRNAFHSTFKGFTEETGIKITTITRDDHDYKEKLPIWLNGESNAPDVMHWQASQRLFYYSRQGLVRPITKLWQDLRLDQGFGHLQSGVSDNGQIYALPIAYYHWGIFYRKSLVEEFGGPQRFWEGFVDQCEKLKQAGITPISIGTKNFWPSAAWFEYLNLRFNDLKFHQQVLSGKVSFYDDRLRTVFERWAYLIEQKYFNADHHEYTWDGVLPHFYRERSAFLLLGNFVATKWPDKLRDDIGFMQFPVLLGKPIYEVAPTDVFMIARHSQNVKQAEAFIKYMARPEIQMQLAQGLSYIPASKNAHVMAHSEVEEAANMLKASLGVSQYFDRETIAEFEHIAVRAFTRFLDDADITRLQRDLERARLQAF